MKYKIGDRVILLSKFGYKNIEEHSVVYKNMLSKNQKYAYIVDIREDKNFYVINENIKDNKYKTGDYFIESDIKLALNYTRKQKLLKLKL